MTVKHADAVADGILSKHQVAGAQLSILNHGKRVWMHVYGIRDDSKTPMATDTAMWAASITKSVFATYFMTLVESRRFALDTPIASYLPKPLPEYPAYESLRTDERWRKITPRMLLSHTAGFANFAFLEPDNKIHIHFEPGTRYAYSGDGINLLQLVIEETLHRPLQDLIREKIFAPLHMNQTSLVWDPTTASNAAGGFDADGKYLGISQRKRARAAGTMNTTIENLTTFTEALFTDTLLSQKARDEMWKPAITIRTKHQFPTLLEDEGTEAPAVGLAYGLGWGLLTKTKYGPAFFKEGHGPGGENYMICFRDSGTCMLMLTNSDNGELAFRDLLEALIHDDVTPWEWESYTPSAIAYQRLHQ